MTRNPPRLCLVAVVVSAVMATAAWAAGGSSSSSSPTVAPSDPRAVARESYDRALKYRDKAWAYEAEMEGADADRVAKLEKKAQKEYQKAIRALRSAVRDDPALFQAYSSLGYALRKTGDFEGSLRAYDQALEIEPRYAEAIEYRAEAYLGLHRLEEAKEAYMQLFRGGSEHADELLTAMREWVDRRRTDPDGVDEATLEAFAAWVDERAAAAEQAAITPATRGGAWRQGS